MRVTERILDSLSTPTTTAATKVKAKPKNLTNPSKGHRSLLLALSITFTWLLTPSPSPSPSMAVAAGFSCILSARRRNESFPGRNRAFGVNKKEFKAGWKCVWLENQGVGAKI